MAVVQRTSSVLEALPRQRPAARTQRRPRSRPAQAAARRLVCEPSIGVFIRRAMIAAIPAVCVLTAVYGRMQLLEASVQRFHLNISVNQELAKKQVWQSAMNNASRQDQLEQFAQEHDLAMRSAPPMFINGTGDSQKDRH